MAARLKRFDNRIIVVEIMIVLEKCVILCVVNSSEIENAMCVFKIDRFLISVENLCSTFGWIRVSKKVDFQFPLFRLNRLVPYTWMSMSSSHTQ